VFRNLSIKGKVVSVIMLTTIIVLLLTVTAFTVYDLVSYRNALVRNLVMTAAITADNSTAVLAFEDEENAQKTLKALKADPHITTAALYDLKGNLFVRYPAGMPASAFPLKPGKPGYYFEGDHLNIFYSVAEKSKQAGTLFISTDLGAVRERLHLYIGIALGVLAGSLALAFALSNALQRRITSPLLTLADSARVVSERADYSLRVQKTGEDELGTLTDAFNLMLERIQQQTIALRESEEKRRLALEAARIGTWDWNVLSDRLTLDNSLHGLLGLKPGEFSGTQEQFLLLLHQEDRKTVSDSLSRALKEKAEFSVEYRVIWPDGSVRVLVSRGKASYSADGKPLRMVGITLDATERRQAEEVRSFLASIVSSSDDAIVGKDLEGRVVSWNAAAEAMFGYNMSEVRGKPVAELLFPERPDEEKQVLEAVTRGAVRHFASIRQRKDGRSIEVSVTVSPIRNAKGQIIGVSSIARDITEAKRIQQALEHHTEVLREQTQMLDLANILARDLDDRVILWNSGMEKMYGWTKADALGKRSHDLLQTRLPIPLKTAREILFREGRWEGELAHTRKDGQVLFVYSLWILHHDAAGKPTAILEINNDLTERKHAEEEVRKLNAELEQRVQERTAELTAANQEMEAFTYSVAHDLRAPLRHIDAFTRILNEDYAAALPEEAKRFLENIRNGSRNMSHLVDDLLNLARIGRQELRRQPVPLGKLVAEVVVDLETEKTDRKIEWRIHPLPSVACDAGLMKQVFINLLSNAMKYTRPQPLARIEVGTMPADGATTIFVKDNGVGFSMKYADKLFGVFQRLHRAEEFEGTGVGLATVDRIIRKHGGKVWAEAEVDKGATFYFSVPN
jgi:PAS domain S-box-containing protein